MAGSGRLCLAPMAARLCCRPEDVTARCAFGLSDASLRRSSLREEYDTGVADDHVGRLPLSFFFFEIGGRIGNEMSGKEKEWSRKSGFNGTKNDGHAHHQNWTILRSSRDRILCFRELSSPGSFFALCASSSKFDSTVVFSEVETQHISILTGEACWIVHPLSCTVLFHVLCICLSVPDSARHHHD